MLPPYNSIGLIGSLKAGGSLFKPTDIPNLSLWLDAADLSTITEVGGSVSQWDDKSGNGNHATQSSAAAQPVTGSRNINGLNVLDFDGGDIFDIPLISRVNGYTVFVINSLDTVTTNPRVYVSGNTGSFTFRVDDTPLQTQVVRTFQAVILGGSDTPAINTNYISSCRTSPAGSNIQINGASVGTNTANPSYTADLRYIGASEFLIDAFNGVMGEILLFTRVLSNAEMNDIGNYLSNKWAISWTNL